MGSISKATWISLLTVWIVGVAITITLATTPAEQPALLRVSDTRGPKLNTALVVMPLEQVRWEGR
ncbi:hypothetical protein [Solirubrobacter soli]|uniref:hypothetical protein n=1 Tax=Solirubrobacter soli TaxID=363832 RepID=UPI00041AC69C|nr:hypothetical protein [Solirubrobacter soli]